MNLNHNFLFGVTALFQEVFLYSRILFHDQLFLGFLFGVIIAILFIGTVLTKDPRHIPLILRYSMSECFEKVDERNKKKNKVCLMTMETFNKTYFRVRILFLVGVAIIFELIILTVLIFPLS